MNFIEKVLLNSWYKKNEFDKIKKALLKNDDLFLTVKHIKISNLKKLIDIEIKDYSITEIKNGYEVVIFKMNNKIVYEI